MVNRPETRATFDRVVDVASVVLISLAAVLSAVCGYQAGRWGGYQAELYSQAEAYRVMAAEAHGKSNELTMIDVGLFLRYLDAVHAGDTEMEQFLWRRLRPEAKPAIKAWLAMKPLQNPHAPPSPFTMPQYRLASTAEAVHDNAQAEAAFLAAQKATRHSDDFLLLTVIFAGVSFLAGISTKLVFPRHVIVVGVGSVALLYGLVRLTGLPFR
jgi:hypothetical protein